MIFSRWNPDGGYQYYESSVRHPIGDDIPVQMPPMINRIGVPSQDVGADLPRDARRIGEGDIPKGILTPMSRDSFQRLAGTTETKEDKTSMIVVALAVTGALLIVGLMNDDKRR